MNMFECGKVINTHGVRGEIKIECHCDDELYAQFKELKIGDTVYKVAQARIHKGCALVALEGFDTVEKAMTLKNKLAFADRDSIKLAEGAYFYSDIYGFDVFDLRVSRVIGKLREVIENPAAILYAIDSDKGEILIPDVEAFFRKVDFATKTMTVETIQGMLPDED